MEAEVVQRIPLEKIEPHPDNRRVGGFDEAKLAQLAESIRAQGIIHPPIVRQVNGHYQLVAGERRWKAAKIAGLTEIPCIVRELDDTAVLKVMTIENLQREDVHPLDEADGYSRLMETGGMDVGAIAGEVGKSISYIYQRLKLLELEKTSRKAFIEGKITAGHAILIARLDPKYQTVMLKKMEHYRGTVSVRDLEDLIQREIFHELVRAAFKKDDAELVPAAGACTACMKRTGAQKDSADVCKKDSCMDPECYDAKIKALVEREKTSPDGKKRELVSKEWGQPESGVLSPSDWEECKKSDKNAKQVLIVSGSEAGKVTWGRKRESYHYTPSAAEKARAEKDKRERAVKTAYRKNLWDAILKGLEKRLSGSAEIPEGILRIIVATVWARLWHNHRLLFAKVEGWEKPVKKPGTYGTDIEGQGNKKIAVMKRDELVMMLLKITMIPDRDLPNYSDAPPKELEAIASQLKIDAKRIKAALSAVKKPAAPAAKKKVQPKAGKAATGGKKGAK